MRLCVSNPELDSALAATGEDPGLCRVELAVHGSEAAGLVRRVRLQYLDWDYQCVLQQVIEDHAIEHVDRAVVTTRREKRVLCAILDLADSLVVVLQVLIRSGAHVHVEPYDLFIIGPQDKVIALGMHGYRRNPLGTCLVLSHHGLLLEVVLEHSLMCCYQEMRLSRVELHRLHYSLGLREGSLRV